MFKKVKDWLGIEGVKLEITDELEVDTVSKTVSGQFVMSSKSEKKVTKVTIQIKERYSRGRRKKSKLVDEYIIAEKVIAVNDSILPDQLVAHDFSIKYDLLRSDMDELGDKNIFYKGLSKIAKIAKNVSSEYYVIIEAHVDGNRLRPFDKHLVALN